MEHVLQNINKLNRSLEGVIAVRLSSPLAPESRFQGEMVGPEMANRGLLRNKFIGWK